MSLQRPSVVPPHLAKGRDGTLMLSDDELSDVLAEPAAPVAASDPAAKDSTSGPTDPQPTGPSALDKTIIPDKPPGSKKKKKALDLLGTSSFKVPAPSATTRDLRSRSIDVQLTTCRPRSSSHPTPRKTHDVPAPPVTPINPVVPTTPVVAIPAAVVVAEPQVPTAAKQDAASSTDTTDIADSHSPKKVPSPYVPVDTSESSTSSTVTYAKRCIPCKARGTSCQKIGTRDCQSYKLAEARYFDKFDYDT